MRKKSEEVTKIPISEIVDKRVAGMSYEDIASEYALSKIMIYGYYQDYAKTGFGGYDPLGADKVTKMCRAEYTIPELARLLNVTPMGLRNYITDYHIKGRDINVRTVKRLISVGKTEAYIGQYYGVTQQTIGRWCKRNGIEIPKNNTWQKQKEIYEQKLAEQESDQ